jgi:hypothetical protein
LHLYVTTENGDEPASTHFAVSNNISLTNNINAEILPYCIEVGTLLVVGLFVYLKKRKREAY